MNTTEKLNKIKAECQRLLAIAEISRKVAATQELQRKQTELEIAQKQEAIKTAEGKAAAALETETAKGKAQAMAEIKKQLTPEFLTYQAILSPFAL